MLKAVIFDMDGTMFDTEKLWGDVTRKLTEKFGIPFDERVRIKMMGKKDSEALTILKEYFHLPVPVDELVQTRRKMVLEDVSLVKVNPGLYELLALLKATNVKTAVATGSFQEFAQTLISRFNLETSFDAVVTGDEVKISKPDPSIFLEAARRIGASPSECLVIEDAQNGVVAAFNAGMKVFAIPNEATRHHDFSKATRIFNSLKEIDASILSESKM